MPGIEEFVAQAENLAAIAFVVDAEQPMQLRTADGGTFTGQQYSEPKLMACIDASLDEDQKTDLLIGRPVTMTLDRGATTWMLMVEPRASGMAIQGERRADASTMTASSHAAQGGNFNYADPDALDLDGPLFEDTGRRTPPPAASDPFAQPAPSSRSRARMPVSSSSGSGQYAPPSSPNRATGKVAAAATRRDGPVSAYEREPTLLDIPTDDDDELTVEGLEIGNTLLQQPSPRNDSTLLQPAPRPPLVDPDAFAAPEPRPQVPQGTILTAGGRAAPPRDGHRLGGAAAVSEPNVTAPEPAAQPVFAPPGARPVAAPVGPAELELEAEAPQERSPHEGTTRKTAVRPPGSRERESSAGRSGTLLMKTGGLATGPGTAQGPKPPVAEFDDGCICFFRQLPEAVEVAERLRVGFRVVTDDEVRMAGRGPSFEELALIAGSALIVALDDPSELVAWALRRREEGFRVFVVTRALTPEGARRVLMGLHACSALERWLDAGPVRAYVAGEFLDL